MRAYGAFGAFVFWRMDACVDEEGRWSCSASFLSACTIDPSDSHHRPLLSIASTQAVAIDPATGKLLPFQILSTRKRKAESEADIKVCVCE